MNRSDIGIIGGGLAGLTSAIILNRSGFKVTVFEKNHYPFHRVCGEYISNEVLPLLSFLGIDPKDLSASSIKNVSLSSGSGAVSIFKHPIGGFGISRFTLDNKLFEIAEREGVKFFQGTKVSQITNTENQTRITTSNEEVFAFSLVLGSYGKRDKLDKQLERNFMFKRSPYMAVKYHVKANYPVNQVGLDSFNNGYCGIVKVEDDRYCICYLTKRENMKGVKSISQMEEKVLFKNPVIKKYLGNAYHLYEKPQVINEISFSDKKPVCDGVLMIGDTAGLITPLCGNGMSMAFASACLACEVIISKWMTHEELSYESKRDILSEYGFRWNQAFKERIVWGRVLQSVFLNPFINKTMLAIVQAMPKLGTRISSRTHGKTLIWNGAEILSNH